MAGFFYFRGRPASTGPHAAAIFAGSAGGVKRSRTIERSTPSHEGF